MDEPKGTGTRLYVGLFLFYEKKSFVSKFVSGFITFVHEEIGF